MTEKVQPNQTVYFSRATHDKSMCCIQVKHFPPSWSLADSYLQCTTMGPASEGLHVLTRRRKARMGVGYSGTPWSGQAMNWNCRTSLFSLEPFCTRRQQQHNKGVRMGNCELRLSRKWHQTTSGRRSQPRELALASVHPFSKHRKIPGTESTSLLAGRRQHHLHLRFNS